jgi:hypothetical protein
MMDSSLSCLSDCVRLEKTAENVSSPTTPLIELGAITKMPRGVDSLEIVGEAAHSTDMEFRGSSWYVPIFKLKYHYDLLQICTRSNLWGRFMTPGTYWKQPQMIWVGI